MSDEPISVLETWSFRELLAAGWTEADLEWERVMADAVFKVAGGRVGESLDGFAQAVRLSRAEFKNGDPRLAASLTNYAAALSDTGENASSSLTRNAAAAWASCERWIESMTVPRTARSSLFHLRMEQRHRPAYEERWKEKAREMLAGVCSRMGKFERLRLVDANEAGERIARWQRERPAGLNDSRKLLGAVVLLVAQDVNMAAASQQLSVESDEY